VVTRASYARLLRRVATEVDTIAIVRDLVARLTDGPTRRRALLRLNAMLDQASAKVLDLERHPGRKV
jgi:hypothetical protein